MADRRATIAAELEKGLAETVSFFKALSRRTSEVRISSARRS